MMRCSRPAAFNADDSGPAHARRLWLWWVLALGCTGVLLRLLHLGLPVRYDEAHSVLTFGGRGLRYALSNYAEPNNHVFHTALVQLVTALAHSYGEVWIRLPAFLAGSAIPFAAAWLALRIAGPEEAVIALALTGTAPVLIDYSTNARGYSLIVLCTLLAVGLAHRIVAHGSRRDWFVLGTIAVLGLYTVPIMLLPWAGICLYILARTQPPRTGVVRTVVMMNSVVASVVVLLYLPILASGQLALLVHNRFVQALTWPAFSASMIKVVPATVAQWSQFLPLPFALTLGVGVATAAATPRHEVNRILAWLVVGGAVVVLLKRNPGFERVWLWLLPIVLIAAAVGLVRIFRHLPGRGSAVAAVLFAGIWTASLSVALLWQRPLWSSRDNGAFPESRAIAKLLGQRMGARDRLLIDPIAREPVRYYLDRLLERGSTPANATDSTTWIVLNRADAGRTRVILDKLAARGVSLAPDDLVAQIGEAQVWECPALRLRPRAASARE